MQLEERSIEYRQLEESGRASQTLMQVVALYGKKNNIHKILECQRKYIQEYSTLPYYHINIFLWEVLCLVSICATYFLLQ